MWSKYQMKGSFYSCLYMVLRYYVLIQQLCPTLLCSCSRRSWREPEFVMLTKGFKKNFLSGSGGM